MEKRFHILGYGMTGVTEYWVNMMNQTQLVDRLYYIVREGAGYILHNEKHYFIKNHLYFINHSLNATYFLEDSDFCHAYIDYTDFCSNDYEEMIDICLEQEELLKADVDTFVCFLRSKSIKGINSNEHKEAFYQYKNRVRLLLEAFAEDAKAFLPLKVDRITQISESIRYIHTNFENEISVKFLARQAHLSQNQYIRLFFKEMGMTPYQYIKNYRLDVAVSMLRRGIAIGEIAEKCGFLSTSAFSSCFKKQFGCAPSEFIG